MQADFAAPTGHVIVIAVGERIRIWWPGGRLAYLWPLSGGRDVLPLQNGRRAAQARE